MSNTQTATDANQLALITNGDLTGDGTTQVTDVTHDSRRAGAGSIFTAVRGELFDAHKFIPQVMQQGAVGVISELERPDDFSGAWIQVDDIRRSSSTSIM
jgi:UDP-N-acetylmuramyl pentapeptide synthase